MEWQQGNGQAAEEWFGVDRTGQDGKGSIGEAALVRNGMGRPGLKRTEMDWQKRKGWVRTGIDRTGPAGMAEEVRSARTKGATAEASLDPHRRDKPARLLVSPPLN